MAKSTTRSRKASKKPNAQDATLRNIRALRKITAALTATNAEIKSRLGILEDDMRARSQPPTVPAVPLDDPREEN